MSFNTILIDFDDTIVDFYEAERFAFFEMAHHFNHQPTEESFQNFREINQQHWEALQRDELTKSQVLSQRFEVYFKQQGIAVDGHKADVIFRDGLATAPIKHFEHTVEVIKSLSKHHDLYIVTNGVTDTQQRRLQRTELKRYIKGIYISEETGFEKPNAAFFDVIFNEIGEERRNESIIVGDSLTSDILGGKNAGIATCWFNYRQKKNHTDISPDYEIENLAQLIDIV